MRNNAAAKAALARQQLQMQQQKKPSTDPVRTAQLSSGLSEDEQISIAIRESLKQSSLNKQANVLDICLIS
ncbi:hypothetical protein SeLEV6574_g02124 [Synchytrium endobioticum]|nr:hypothetical protein SeLEV6574_g02124 [Synchytrium endobioticum]